VEFLGEVAPLLCYELKKCKTHLLYLADIYSKFSEIQKRLLGRDVTIIQARTIIMGFQVNLGLFKNSLDRRDCKYFSNLKHFSTALQTMISRSSPTTWAICKMISAFGSKTLRT
jgi:hypothetical protein